MLNQSSFKTKISELFSKNGKNVINVYVISKETKTEVDLNLLISCSAKN